MPARTPSRRSSRSTPVADRPADVAPPVRLADRPVDQFAVAADAGSMVPSPRPPADPAAAPVAPVVARPSALPPGYRGLRVWQRALELATGVYVLSTPFSPESQDALGVPLRRAAAAVAAAIAEGNVRFSAREYAHYVSQAIGTVAEVETLLHISVRLGLCDEAAITPLLGHCAEIGRMLRALARTIQSPSSPIEGSRTRRRATTVGTPTS